MFTVFPEGPTSHKMLHPPTHQPWPFWVDYFSHTVISERKNGRAGFVPAVWSPDIHELDLRRRNNQIQAITALVYDADQGNFAAVERVLAWAEKYGKECLAYSSFSNVGKDAPIFPARIIFPLVEPLNQLEKFKAIRAFFAKSCDMPADLSSSSGLCHFYYSPTTQPGQEFWFRHIRGTPVYAPSYYIPDKKTASFTSPRSAQTETITLDDARKKLQDKLERLEKYADEPDEKLRATWYKNMLNGEALADDGQRHTAIVRMAHSVLFTIPTLTDEQICELLWPSVELCTRDGAKRPFFPSDLKKIVQSSRAKYDATAVKAVASV